MGARRLRLPALWRPVARRAALHPVATLAAVVALSALPAAALLDLELATDGGTLHPEGGLTVRRNREDRATFREPEAVILLVTARSGGPPVASPAGFRHVKALHAAVARSEGVAGEGVRSLADLLAPPDGPQDLYVRELAATVPEDAPGFRRLLERFREHPLADGLFLSADGTAAALYVPLAGHRDRLEELDALERFLAARPAAPFDLRLTGPVVAEARLGDAVFRDLARLTPLLVAAVAVLLFLALGTPGGVLVPMAEVLAVLVWTLGAMALSGVPVTLVTTVVPAVLVAMAVADEIHLLERYQSRLAARAAERPLDRWTAREAMDSALEDVARPLILTSATTALGFLSFAASSIRPLGQFGVFCALGILAAMAFSFTLVPALVALLPPAWFLPPVRRRGRTAALAPWAEGLLARIGRWPAVALGVLLLAIVPGLQRLRVQDSWVQNFPPGSDVVTADRDLNDRFWGSYRFDVVLEGPEPGYFRKGEGLALAEEVRRRALAHPAVSGVVSHLVPLEIVARGWGEPLPVSALPPEILHRALAWLRVISRRIDLAHYVTEDAASVRLRLLVDSPDFRRGRELAAFLDREVAPLARSRGVACHTSGELGVAVEVVGAIVGGQLRSLALTLGTITVLLVLALRSLRRALVVVAPVATATGLVLGGMGYLGVPLGIATSMFAALTLGVGLDFALHFEHGYSARRAVGAGHAGALAGTLRSSGRAVRWNAAVLALGFLVLTVSELRPNRGLGWLLAAGLGASYLTTLLLMPELLRRTAPEREAGGLQPENRPGEALGGPPQGQLGAVGHPVGDG